MLDQSFSLENEPEKIQKRETSKNTKQNSARYKAYIYAILSSLSLVLMQMNLKHLSKHFNPPLITSIRGSFLFILNFLYLNYKGTPIHKPDKTSTNAFRNLLKRAIFSSITVILYLTSVKYISIGIANALFNTSPILTFIIETFYYKKNKIHVANFIITIISFIGVLFIIQPSFLFPNQNSHTPENYVFYFVVLLAAVTGSFSMIFLHDLRGKVDQLVVLQHGYFIQNCMSLIVYLFTVTPQQNQKSISYLANISLEEILFLIIYICLFVAFSFLLQILIAKAMYLSSPAVIMPFSYVSVIFGLVIDLVIYDAKYNWLMIIGMIMASGGLFTKFIMVHLDKK